MLVDEAGDKAGVDGFGDEFAQEGGAGGVAAERADGLLHGGELAGEDAGAFDAFDVGQQAGLEAGEGVELVADEAVEGGVEAVGVNQRGVVDVAVEPEAVSTSSTDCSVEPGGTR